MVLMSFVDARCDFRTTSVFEQKELLALERNGYIA